MKIFKSLPFRNLAGRPGRTAALVLLTAFLSFTILGGTLTVSSLRTGLASLEARLGADIMVVPYEAVTKSSLENIVLQGNTGYFYMDSSYLDKVAAREGIDQISAQFYLASASSGCCSIPVQIIGFDPETDFTISPWIRKSYGGELQDLDIVVGNDLNAFVGDTLLFYGTECRVAAKLDKTGTTLDTAVYTNENTIRTLIQSSLDQKMNDFGDIDPARVISCILVNVADGYSVEEVLNDINLHVRRVVAVRTTDMISGVSDSLESVSDVIGLLIAAVWLLDLVILLLAFTMSVNERKKEFAILRVMGASRKKLALLIMQEVLLAGLLGSAAGTAAGLGIILPFGRLIEEMTGLPFLFPGPGQIAWFAVIAILAAAAAGAVSAAFSAYRISRIDTGLILREDN